LKQTIKKMAGGVAQAVKVYAWSSSPVPQQQQKNSYLLNDNIGKRNK
jgi:hypothetical protein